MEVETKRRDPLRRFTPTPLVADLGVMGRTVRLETNNPIVLEQTRRIFEHHGPPRPGRPEFLWRIVGETHSRASEAWPAMSVFSDGALRYINLGQRSFFAVDLEARMAVGFLPQEWAEDALGFSAVFLARLFYLTSGALQLTAVSAACVAWHDTGLLIFGPLRSGKTTSSYYALKLGLVFHADQATFLDLESGSLRAWGDFWPASFRVETAKFLPELLTLSHPFSYQDHSFLFWDKNRADKRMAQAVTPVYCVFLERQGTETPRLIPLSRRALEEGLKENMTFEDDERFEEQRGAVCRALAQLPAYRLVYGSDPTVAAKFYRSLLGSRDLQETSP